MDELDPLCFWCGGNARFWFTSEPRPMRPDPATPCIQCESIRKMGIAIYEVINQDPGCNNLQAREGVWFTGRWTVVDEKQVEMLFTPDWRETVLKERIACMRADVYKAAHLDHYPWRTIQ